MHVLMCSSEIILMTLKGGLFVCFCFLRACCRLGIQEKDLCGLIDTCLMGNRLKISQDRGKGNQLLTVLQRVWES